MIDGVLDAGFLGIASLPKVADCISDYGGHVLGSSVQLDLVTI